MSTKKKVKANDQDYKLRGRHARIARRMARQAPPPEIDDRVEPELPIGAFLEIADWMFDHALVAADGDERDIHTVERVRAFVHDRIEGVPARTPAESELLTTVALAVAAMEKRHGMTGLGELVAQSVGLADGRGPRRGPWLTPHLYCVP